MIAFIALGSNLGDRRKNIAAGMAGLERLGRATPSPLIVETEDESGVGPPYLNTVAKLDTSIGPCALLEECLRIELACGRDRALPSGSPRTLDLDLIMAEGCNGSWEWGAPDDLSQIGRTLTLVLPHPRAVSRKFVMEPLEALHAMSGD